MRKALPLLLVMLICSILAFFWMTPLFKFAQITCSPVYNTMDTMKDSRLSPQGHLSELKHSDDAPVHNDLKVVRKNGAVSLAQVDLDKLDSVQVELTIHSVLDNTDTVCTRKLRMGKIGDGGWEVCDDPDVAPTPPCLIYSFGINGDWSFDDDVSRVYGCHVYAFDPSMKQAQHNRSKLVHFYNVGISNETIVNSRQWQLHSLADLKKKFGHANTSVDVIKMDVESAEWASLPQMVSSGALRGVKQLFLEFHVLENSVQYLLPRLKAVQSIEKLGFRKFYVHKNIWCGTYVETFPVTRSRCYEVHYLRR